MSFDLKSFIGGVAPTIAQALGGPLAATAVDHGLRALGITPKEKAPAENLQTLAGAIQKDPSVLLKLVEGENSFKLELERLGVDLEKVHAADRASAREANTKTGDKTYIHLAYAVLVLYGFCVWFAFFGEVPADRKEMVFLIIGGVTTRLDQIFNYIYGSSAGSKAKTELMAGK